VYPDGVGWFNTLGCLDHFAAGCGDALYQHQECARLACEVPCGKVGPERDACVRAAEASVCAATRTTAVMVCGATNGSLDGPAVKACTFDGTLTWELALVTQFCGR